MLWFTAILLLALSQIMCSRTTPTPPPVKPEDDQSVEDLPSAEDLQACEATEYLSVTPAITKEETNEFGSYLCNYSLTITNTHPGQPIRYFIYQHSEDGYQGTKSDEWMNNFPIAPGGSLDWQGYVPLYTDPDASGPVMRTATYFGGIFDTEPCSKLFINETYLFTLSNPLLMTGPVE